MPKINNLTDDKPNTQPATRPASDHAPTPTTSDLIKSKPTTGGLVIPSFLQKVEMPETVSGDLTGFIGFASSASNKWAEQQSAGLVDGQPYVCKDSRFIPLKSLDFFLLLSESFQSLMVGKEGKFHFVTRDLDIEGPMVGSNRTQPHYVCLVLVDVNGSLMPIKGDFIGTKSSGMENAIRAVRAASTPDWLRLSEAHKITAAFPEPFGRVYHRITTKMQVSKTSGNPYYRANCTSFPASVERMQALTNALSNVDFIRELEEAKSNYDRRIEFLDNIAKNGVQVAATSR